MTTPLKIAYIVPMAAAMPAWHPKTAEETRRWVREANEMSARDRAGREADHQRTTADLAKISREVEAETARRQQARGGAPKRAPAGPPSVARGRRALDNIRESYAALNQPAAPMNVHDFYREREEERQRQLAAMRGAR